MDQQGMKADSDLYVCLLQACACTKSLSEGKWVHTRIIKRRFRLTIFLANTIINMYIQCGCLPNAQTVFDSMLTRNVFTWTMMIASYAKHGHSEEAIKLFHQMEYQGVNPNDVTFVNILKACASLGALDKGKQIHAQIIKAGFQSDVFVGSALVDMYTKCGCTEIARQVFDSMPTRNVVSWTAMIRGYSQEGLAEEAIQLFHQMRQEGMKPDEAAFVSIIKACSSLALLKQGLQIHADIIRYGFCSSNIIVGNALVDMYAKCGSIKHARELFDQMHRHDIISWNAMIMGYAQLGYADEAFALFQQMKRKGIKPNQVTFLGLLKACSCQASLKRSKQVHTQIITSGVEIDIHLENSLVYTNAKSGSLDHAHQIFDQMSERDIVSWNSIIAGYAQHGNGSEVLQLVKRMQYEGLKMDDATFVGILSACSHSGLVDEGLAYFESMCRDHGITPKVEHYVCMVDLLGRADSLEETQELVKLIPFQPPAVIWRALLNACRIQGNMELAKHAAENFDKMDPQNSTNYLLFSSIYATAGMQVENDGMMKERGQRRQTK